MRKRTRSESRNSGKRRYGSDQEYGIANPKTMDTVYRILCPSKKIGGVIGKGGTIINALRDETHAKIRVADSIPGVDERVIIIFSSSTKKAKSSDLDHDEDDEHKIEDEKSMDSLCAAQDALLRVHERIIAEEDKGGAIPSERDGVETTVFARLLVPSSQVGCLLGRGGNIIQKLRNDTNANIRVLPPDFLPHGAASSDELVQISGSLDVVKNALYEVSTLLFQNPRKETPNAGPMGPPHFNQMVPEQGPRRRGYRGKSHRSAPDGYGGGPPVSDTPEEVSVKLLCSPDKIGGIIGRGGSKVKQVEQETGARIVVEDLEADENERAIVVSSIESARDRFSPTIEAILQLLNKISGISENGVITTRLLVPSSKVGCIIGESGHVISEMRRRTQADIRVYSKNDKPKCASAHEELVQISGPMRIARDALLEILSRLRDRILFGPGGGMRPYVPFHELPPNSSTVRGPPSSLLMRPRTPGGYDPLKGGVHEDYVYPSQPSWSRYSGMGNPMEPMIPSNAMPPVVAPGGNNFASINQMDSTNFKLQDPALGSSDYVAQMHGSYGNVKMEDGFFQPFPPGGPPLSYPPGELVYHEALNAAV